MGYFILSFTSSLRSGGLVTPRPWGEACPDR